MSIKKWHILGAVFVFGAGVLSHFANDYFPGCEILRCLCPVSESVWEHLKLLFWPSVLFMVAEYIAYGRGEADFFAVKMTAVTSAMLFTVCFFYTYSGILGFNLLLIDILCFMLSVLVYQYVSLRLFSDFKAGSPADGLKGAAALVLFAVAFVVWTDTPPDIGLFW